MKIFEAVTVGGAVKDIMFYSDELFIVPSKKGKAIEKLLAVEYGQKVAINDVFVNYGGGAMNVAVGLKNFGIHSAPMINVGRDLVGKEIYAHLKKNGISTYLITVDKMFKTGFSVIITSAKDKEHVIFTYKGASSNLEVSNLKNFRANWFYVSALSNKNWPIEFEKITRQIRRGVKIVWNPGLAQLKNFKALTRFLDEIEVLILNKDEARGLIAEIHPLTSKEHLDNAKYLLKKIKEFGCRKAIITQGAKGLAAIDEDEKYYYMPAKSLASRIVDTTGAGDAFGSGFLAGMIRWNDFEKALRLGLNNSAHVLYRIGAQNGLLKIKL